MIRIEKNFSLMVRIRFISLVSLALLIGGLTLNSYLSQRWLFREFEQGRERPGRGGQLIIWEMGVHLERLEQELLRLAKIEDLKEAFSKKDRGELLEQARPPLNRLRKSPLRVERISFYMPSGTVFLRAHNPDSYGDDVSGHRLLIAKAAKDRRIVRGLEAEGNTFFLWAATPLYNKGQFTGILEIGTPVSFFLQEVKNHLGTEAGLFVKNALSTSKFTPVEATDRGLIDRVAPLLVFSRGLTTPTRQVVVVTGRTYTATLIPIKDFSPDQGAVFGAFSDVTPLTQLLRGSTRNLIGISAGGFLLAAILIFFLTHRLEKAHRSLEARTAELTAAKERELREAEVLQERKRAEEEIRRSLERVRALREIDQAITSTLDLRTVLDVLLEKIEIFLPYSTATVRLFNKVSGLLEPVACRNLDEKEWKVAPWKAGRGPANAVFESKAPLVIRNCYNDPRVKDPEFFRKHRLVSYLGVPMVAKEEILGVLSFYTKEEHEFTSEEAEFLTTLVGQAAIAIHNSRLYEETERRRREAEELARVAQSLTETLDMTAVGERIVTSVRELFGVKASTLRLLQPDGSLRTLASTGEGFSISYGGGVLPIGTGLASVAVAEGRPIWSADVLNEPRIRLTDQMRDYQLRSGNRSMIAVPLRAHEKIIGALGLSDQTGRIYSDSEVALLQTFADQAALALENARLYEETRAREAQLQETNRMLSALHSVAAAASQSLDLDRVLQAAIEKIIDIFRFDATGIYIYDEQMNELLLRVSLASDRERFTQPRSFVGGQGIVGKVVESGKPSIFEDIETDPLYRQLSRSKSAKQLGHRFFAVFPVKGKQKNVGALTCMGVAPRRLNSNEIQLLEAVADQVAVAIENSQLYGEMVKLAADLSRSNKVKDEFLSVMSHELRTPLNVVMGYTGMIKDRMLGEINPEQEKALEKVISRARDQLTMISSILQATQLEAEGVKVESQEFSLGDFLGDLRSSYEGSFGKELTLIWDYPSDLPVIKTDSEKLKHILQNLINNAIKFTEKGSVKVSARCLPDFQIAEFKVSDTGIGIAQEYFPIIFERFRQVDSSETRAYGGVGIGLYIVKRFTELLGGKVEVESDPGKGSTFTVTIPCESYQSVVDQQGLMAQG